METKTEKYTGFSYIKGANQNVRTVDAKINCLSRAFDWLTHLPNLMKGEAGEQSSSLENGAGTKTLNIL